MGYATCETAVATVIKTIVGYDANNVTSGDYRVFAKGKMKAVILEPGAFRDHGKFDDSRHRTHWVVNINLFIGFKDEITTVREEIRAERQKIIDMLDKYPTLGDTSGVVISMVTSGDEPDLWAIGSRKWWHQVMYCEIEERAVVTYA